MIFAPVLLLITNRSLLVMIGLKPLRLSLFEHFNNYDVKHWLLQRMATRIFQDGRVKND